MIHLKNKVNFFVSILISFLLFTYILNAQNYEIADSINVGKSNIKDLKINNYNYFLLNNNYIYKIDNFGKILDSNKVDRTVTGICFKDHNLLLIYENGVIKNKFDSILINLNINNRVSKFITYKSLKYFTYLLVGKFSYSNSIILFNNQGKRTIFTYLVGAEAGLYCSNNYLWHLSNKVIKNKFGILRKYNISNGKLLSEEILPVKDPVGIGIDSNSFIYTYSTKTKKIYKLKKK